MTASGIEIVFAEGMKPEQSAAVQAYIKHFEEKNLPAILSSEHLSLLLGIKQSALYAISNSANAFYRTFYVRKKNGGKRQISAPLPLLLAAQQWILSKILESVAVHPAAKAYKKGSSIKENARFHRGQESLFKSDVEDFFGSISQFWVYEFFRSLGYTTAIARLLAGLCCKNGVLPQGAATSGYLSNIYMYQFDDAVFNYCRTKRLRYTRYADDIAISGAGIELDETKDIVSTLLKNHKLRINLRKTRIQRRNTRQKITGVVVNDRLGPDRQFLRRIRQDVHYIRKFGVHGHARHRGFRSPLFCINNLLGRITHARFLLGRNTPLEEEKKYLERLLDQIS